MTTRRLRWRVLNLHVEARWQEACAALAPRQATATTARSQARWRAARLPPTAAGVSAGEVQDDGAAPSEPSRTEFSGVASWIPVIALG